jgi:HTH-type transcriptional regulator/antitoxin HigA
LIASRVEYEEALSEVRRLVEANPPESSPEAERLRVLALLVETYEQERFPIEAPTPLEAIRFRMVEQGLSQRDLEPFIGSKSKVSEILGGKLGLTLRMIRGLHRGLGIPADVLLGERAAASPQESKEPDWQRFPLREMANRGWFGVGTSGRADLVTAVRTFIAQVDDGDLALVYWRRALAKRVGVTSDQYSLLAWVARVVIRSRELVSGKAFRPGSVTADLLRQIAQLSALSGGPRQAVELLAQEGIPVVIEPHLPKTRVDGATVVRKDGTPVVGLTLRYDRLDSFWFTLLHELAHVHLHADRPQRLFVDDLDVQSEAEDEVRADRLASETFIPRTLWVRSSAFKKRTPEAIVSFAYSLGISPAIVAGRLRRETGNYRAYGSLVGHRQVRLLFPEVRWS